MKPRVLLNANFGQSAAALLRAEGYEVALANDLFPAADDRVILAWAHDNNYLVITKDHHFNDLIHRDGQPHAGVVRLSLGGKEGKDRELLVLRNTARSGKIIPGQYTDINPRQHPELFLE